jgi:hypothetical protein
MGLATFWATFSHPVTLITSTIVSDFLLFFRDKNGDPVK